MRISNRLAGPLVATAFLPGLAHAALGIAGAIDNALQASLLQGLADELDVGTYTIKNVQTGQALTYNPSGNHIVPADGAGTPVTVSHYSDSVSWIRMQIGNKNKCLSAQWGGSYDHAGVMYECAVFGNGAVKADNTLEPTKQWWLAVPVNSDFSGSGSGSSSFLAAAQEDSVKTREDAIASGQSKNAFATKHRRHLESRKMHRTPLKAHETSSNVVAVVKTDKKKSSSKSKSKSKVKSSSKTKTKSKSKSSSSSSGSSSAVQLNAVTNQSSNNADGQKYYIIAVDHLIDMHTMALIGQSMATAGNTQSTALATFNSGDTLQQWTITKA